ncbi:cyclase [Burkholderia sp. MSh2]|uniref:Cyclase n=1 Tax=Burkholderia paludis TaxID=1506587 RepID=A0A6J5CYH4_9BURK|nr:MULTISPECIES: cyclase family protein [Burkholderia]KEZ05858.1 cyclase [Burkholderia sp. MSh2]CAB3746024.1 Kynurenine formamidase [Burkholderia paludis]VWB22844.1 cyclase [Burkholderia paludis]
MSKKIIDLSVALQEDIASDPEAFLPRIDRVLHRQGARQLADCFPGLEPAALRDEEGWAVEFVQMSTHAGTHMDAPFHYRSHQDDGTPALTIDQIPLDWCFGPGVKLDFRHFPDGYVVTPADIDAELARIGHTLKAGDIVLVNTAAGARYGHDDFIDKGCGMGRDATLHLTRQGVRIVGTDAWSWDAPFRYTKQRFDETRDPSIIWEGHFAGSTVPYCQIEKLANLEQLPAHGFDVISLPVKVARGSAGWARPVAVIDA